MTGEDETGGLAGLNKGGTISGSQSSANVSGTGDTVGGLVGINDASASIVNSYATGDATNTNSTGAAGNWVGGLVGDNLGSIKAAYATGKVANSTSWQGIVGGLAGRNAGTIDSVYATGQITSNNVGGGLIGDNQAGIVTNAYWDRESTGKMYAVSSGDGTGIGNISDGISPYFSNSYLKLNNGGKAWTTLAGADSTVRVAKDAKGKVVWVIIDGATRPFLASEWSTNITNLHQLQLMSMNLKAKYVLANDISIPAGVMPVLDINGNLSTAVNKSGMWSNLGFMPVGTAKYSAFNNKITTTPFAGSFDGQGHSISGLVINRAGGLDPDNMGLSNFLGMFGVNSGKISNITLNNVYVVGPTQSQTFNSVVVPGSTGVGALVGLNLRGSISNAHVANSVRDFNATKGIVSAFAGGGLVGINVGGSIANSSAAIYVRNSGYFAGGLVGLSLNGKISGSRAVGAVSSSGASGGLVGMNTGTIDQSRADGDLNSGSMLMGGLVGVNTSDREATSLLASSGVKLPSVVKATGKGTGSITQSRAQGAVTVSGTEQGISHSIGGLVGLNGGKIDRSYALGSVTFDGQANEVQNVGGLAGVSTGTISGSRASTALIVPPSGTAVDYMGGLVGRNEGKISTSHVDNDVENGRDYIGGLVGYNGSKATISTSSVVNIEVSGNGKVGGLAGVNLGKIDQSYTRGVEVEGIEYVGGLAGYNVNLNQSYARGGSVSGEAVVGGLVGYNSSLLQHSYVYGSVTGTEDVGALVGVNGGQVKNSFWNSDYTVLPAIGSADGISISTGSRGLTTAGFRDASNFAGWSLDTVGGAAKAWRLYADDPSGAPILKAFLTKVTVTAGGGKVYDGAINQNGASWTASDPLAAPELSGSPVYSIKNAKKNAGKYTISVSGFYSDQNGYDIVYKNGTYIISKATLNVTDVTALDKVYDGKTTAKLNHSACGADLLAHDCLSGAVAGDQVRLVFNKATATFEDKNAGVDKVVKAKGYTLTGADAVNYTLVQPTDLEADITPKQLTVSGYKVKDLAYDGFTTAATLTGKPKLVGMISGDKVALDTSGVMAYFADPSAGMGKDVTVTGLALSGAGASNYTLDGTLALTGNIVAP